MSGELTTETFVESLLRIIFNQCESAVLAIGAQVGLFSLWEEEALTAQGLLYILRY